MGITMDDIFWDGKVVSQTVKKNRWAGYLAITDNVSVNYERVKCMSEITGRETLEYVLRTLDILDRCDGIDEHDKNILRTVLQWCEVAKGGTAGQRMAWLEKGYPLDIHNLASAEIYLDECTDNVADAKIIYTLIKTHGAVGQFLRGEVNYDANMALISLINNLDNEYVRDGHDIRGRFCQLIRVLNRCIIEAVDEDLWKLLQDKADKMAYFISEGKEWHMDARERLNILIPGLGDVSHEDITFFAKNIFPFYELWYFSSALCCFSCGDVVTLMKRVMEYDGIHRVSHFNFKKIADELYYDYEGSRHINVYKQRVIEKYLKTGDDEHMSLDIEIINGTAMIGFRFSNACRRMIEFCVEAERSGLLTYEKSITALFDMFGFRRDGYDRLNNEDKYLCTMNDCADSKRNIPNYVVGSTIVDVGSGGGVMLDLLEERYPDKVIIGTDVSQNVIMSLEARKKLYSRKWNAVVHNFIEKPLDIKADTVIFSSILHEIFSYSDIGHGCFDIESVKTALSNAVESLNQGGRIIIRDGVKSYDGELEIGLNDDAYDVFELFVNDFHGLPEVPRNMETMLCKSWNGKSKHAVKGDINFIREFMYTYTWGKESYSHEVNEQFGYFTLKEYVCFLEEIGLKIVEAYGFLEDGYYEHLKDSIELAKEDYPNSNLFIVAQKP